MTKENKTIHGKVIATYDSGDGLLAVFQTMTEPEDKSNFRQSKSGAGYEVTLPNQEKLEAGARASVVVCEFGSLALRSADVSPVATPEYMNPRLGPRRRVYLSPIGDPKVTDGAVAPRVGAQSFPRR